MRLTILGKSPAWQDAGGACSGYLIEHEGRSALIDCGNGVFGKLRERVDYRSVEAVVISHLHGDHTLDLVPFSYALTLGPRPDPSASRPRLRAPLGAGKFCDRLAGTWGDAELIGSAFEVDEYEPGARFEVAGVSLEMIPVKHFTATHAVSMSVAGADGGRIVYGADGRASEELIEAARGAVVLIAEATLADPDPAPVERQGHMSASEAGRVAAEAGVGRLVLTHVSDELDLERSRRLAAEQFAGEVTIAAEGVSFEV